MPIYFNLLIVASYGIVAAALAVAVPAEDIPVPYMLAALAFAFGGLVHGQVARLLRERELHATMETLVASQRQLKREVEDLRVGVVRAHEVLNESQARSGGSAVSEIISEVRVLHSLIEQLFHRRARTTSLAVAESAVAESAVAVGGGGRRAAVARGGERQLPTVATGLNEAQILNIVREGLKSDRVDLYLQPVVSLPQRKRRFYECYSRIRAEDNSMITPDQYLPIAAREGLIGAIDNMLLFRCVQLIRKVRTKHREVGFFCNVSPNNLSDNTFFTDFVEFMVQNAELAPHIYFEFAQADVARFDAATLKQLGFLARHGFRFSLDRVADLALDPRELRQRGFTYVKIDAALLVKGVRSDPPALDLATLKDGLDRLGIDLIVEKVESEQDLVELLDYRIDYAQGFLFGEPRPSREA